jgi:hypothetical protein
VKSGKLGNLRARYRAKRNPDKSGLFIQLLRQVRSAARRIFKMARFPTTEPEVIPLAHAMVSGLTGNAVLYPSPPVLPAALATLVRAYITPKNTAIAAVAAGKIPLDAFR